MIWDIDRNRKKKKIRIIKNFRIRPLLIVRMNKAMYRSKVIIKKKKYINAA